MKKLFNKDVKRVQYVRTNYFGWEQFTFLNGNFVEEPRKQKNYYLPRQ